ncbi:mitofusin-1-like isoform X2 [Poeciliopsis prolifica]|uniref:mitofusin-1-like isoform X2 n=1 Tax=Poeciliopsis prolifica TaxID=188132 RepID=UPI002413F3A5|nr:mitofusin-1-like isoform X2 [Poeciliopsis prolifica]
MDPDDPSPLHRFVVAKRSIGSIFDQLLEFVKNGSAFVDEAVQNQDLGPVAVEEQNLEMQSCANKLAAIREVLLRRTMKVAFFGRTSNGKSTVINAMLRERVLPSGIGHTTNCFLSVEGTDAAEPYLTTEASAERHAVSTVNQLAHALHMDPALDSGSLVRVFWPKNRCALLRDDLVLMDSPGTDVTLELDSWIDKFCLDADVFVLVGNAESTLMNTEKLFFHKVSERISKPNVFILHNRWDASVTEPELIDQVKKQHLDRCISFLSEELRVVEPDRAASRIFFISAKEALICRTQRNQGMPETGVHLSVGGPDQVRAAHGAGVADHRGHQDHHGRHQHRFGRQEDLLPGGAGGAAGPSGLRPGSDEPSERQREEPDRNPDGRRHRQGGRGAAGPDPISAGSGGGVPGRLQPDPGEPGALQSYSVRPLVSPSVQQQLCAPSSSFEMTFDLSLAALCADFREDIDFRFSLGWSALVTRFIGAHRALAVPEDGPTLKDRLVVSMATSLVSVSSRASMAVLLIGGVVWRSVGWRVVALSVSLYGLLYLYERLTWTASSQERALKQQFTEFAAFRLRAVVPVTSSACSQQVFKELTSTFSRLTQRVDLSEAELEGRIRQLTCRIQRLEATQRKSKAFRNRATELETQLEAFSARYLQAAD